MLHPLHLIAISVGARERLNSGEVAKLCSLGGLCDPLLDPHLYRLRGVPGLHAGILYASLLVDRLGDNFDVIYVDVGSRRVPARPGNLFLEKHSESVQHRKGGRVICNNYHMSRPPLGPLLLLSAASGRVERVRQASRYLLEIGRVYALLTKDGPPRLIVKHGPLLEMIHVYLNQVYNSDERVYRQVLLHAGLEPNTVDALLAAGRVGDKVNPGLVALEVIKRIAEVNTSRRDRIAVGVVEDTSGSRHLVAQLLYEAILAAVIRNPYTALASTLEEYYQQGFQLLNSVLQVDKCLSDTPPLDVNWLRDMLLRVTTRLAARGTLAQLSSVKSGLDAWRLAASVYQELGGSELVDADVVLLASFLAGSLGTSVYVQDAILSLVRDTAELRLGGSLYKTVGSVLDSLVHLEAYILPGLVPSCRELLWLANRLGLQVPPDVLSGLVYAPLPLRVDTVGFRGGDITEVHDKLVEASGFVLISAASTVYKLPPGLIVADVRSRISLNEALILAEISRKLAGRLQPYAVLLRHWPRRSATL